ncbi:hypothetical protein [Microbulbifer sp. ARAS458-1]
MAELINGVVLMDDKEVELITAAILLIVAWPTWWASHALALLGVLK